MTAAEPALGWPEGSFQAAYTLNRGRGERGGAGVVAAVRAAAQFVTRQPSGEWEGTSSDLLQRRRRWPGSPSQSRRTGPSVPGTFASPQRLAPDLRRVGVSVERSRAGKNRTRTITVRSGTQCPLRPPGHNSRGIQGVRRTQRCSGGDAAPPQADADGNRGNPWKTRAADAADAADAESPVPSKAAETYWNDLPP